MQRLALALILAGLTCIGIAHAQEISPTETSARITALEEQRNEALTRLVLARGQIAVMQEQLKNNATEIAALKKAADDADKAKAAQAEVAKAK